ncbi:MAG: transglutaminase domain-containing protein, partial [candidate division NC10 bacterium]|nr:transglutaminase domain-containing protein [candidate division NC10 bacterium]
YSGLLSDRLDASTQIKEKTGSLTASKNSVLDKMRSVSEFVQHDIRYVAIELGIGGWQPHAASDVFQHRYGDCKDKATLMRSMLREIGVDSYHVVINTQRGSVTPDSPARHAFNHAIMAVKLPDGLTDPSLIATMQHPTLGRILFFDPTDPITPFGQIRGDLDAEGVLSA